MVMAFNPDDPHDGHAAGDGGFTYRMVHIWPEFFASLTGVGRPLPVFGSPVLHDTVTARALRRLHAALTGPASELERYECLTATAACWSGTPPGPSRHLDRRGPDPIRAWPRGSARSSTTAGPPRT